MKGNPGECRKIPAIELVNDDFADLLEQLKEKIRQKYKIDDGRDFSLSYQSECTVHQHENLTGLEDADDMEDIWTETDEQRVFIKFREE